MSSIDKKLYVVIGHYGSGKTEFAVNLALRLSDSARRTAICDLDFINPYFRSRDRDSIFRERGIRLIGSPEGCSDTDVPAISSEINALFDDDTLSGVIDAGGDALGARVLRRFAPKLRGAGAIVLCVVNFRRPKTHTALMAERAVREIEAASGLRIDCIVNNTHVLGETDLKDLCYGAGEAAELSRLCGIPVCCHTACNYLSKEAGEFMDPVFPMEIYMKKPWE